MSQQREKAGAGGGGSHHSSVYFLAGWLYNWFTVSLSFSWGIFSIRFRASAGQPCILHIFRPPPPRISRKPQEREAGIAYRLSEWTAHAERPITKPHLATELSRNPYDGDRSGWQNASRWEKRKKPSLRTMHKELYTLWKHFLEEMWPINPNITINTKLRLYCGLWNERMEEVAWRSRFWSVLSSVHSSNSTASLDRAHVKMTSCLHHFRSGW